MKRLLCVLFACSLLLASGCGAAAKEKIVDLSAFADNVMKSVEYDDELIALSDKVAGNYYDLDFDGLEEFVIYVSASSATVNELAVFRCKDSAAMDEAKQAVEARLDNQREAYENYRPDELLRLDNALIRSEGSYLLLSVSDDNEAVEKLFSDTLK